MPDPIALNKDKKIIKKKLKLPKDPFYEKYPALAKIAAPVIYDTKANPIKTHTGSIVHSYADSPPIPEGLKNYANDAAGGASLLWNGLPREFDPQGQYQGKFNRAMGAMGGVGKSLYHGLGAASGRLASGLIRPFSPEEADLWAQATDHTYVNPLKEDFHQIASNAIGGDASLALGFEEAARQRQGKDPSWRNAFAQQVIDGDVRAKRYNELLKTQGLDAANTYLDVQGIGDIAGNMYGVLRSTPHLAKAFSTLLPVRQATLHQFLNGMDYAWEGSDLAQNTVFSSKDELGMFKIPVSVEAAIQRYNIDGDAVRKTWNTDYNLPYAEAADDYFMGIVTNPKRKELVEKTLRTTIPELQTDLYLRTHESGVAKTELLKTINGIRTATGETPFSAEEYDVLSETFEETYKKKQARIAEEAKPSMYDKITGSLRDYGHGAASAIGYGDQYKKLSPTVQAAIPALLAAGGLGAGGYGLYKLFGGGSGEEEEEKTAAYPALTKMAEPADAASARASLDHDPSDGYYWNKPVHRDINSLYYLADPNQPHPVSQASPYNLKSMASNVANYALQRPMSQGLLNVASRGYNQLPASWRDTVGDALAPEEGGYRKMQNRAFANLSHVQPEVINSEEDFRIRTTTNRESSPNSTPTVTRTRDRNNTSRIENHVPGVTGTPLAQLRNSLVSQDRLPSRTFPQGTKAYQKTVLETNSKSDGKTRTRTRNRTSDITPLPAGKDYSDVAPSLKASNQPQPKPNSAAAIKPPEAPKMASAYPALTKMAIFPRLRNRIRLNHFNRDAPGYLGQGFADAAVKQTSKWPSFSNIASKAGRWFGEAAGRVYNNARSPHRNAAWSAINKWTSPTQFMKSIGNEAKRNPLNIPNDITSAIGSVFKTSSYPALEKAAAKNQKYDKERGYFVDPASPDAGMWLFHGSPSTNRDLISSQGITPQKDPVNPAYELVEPNWFKNLLGFDPTWEPVERTKNMDKSVFLTPYPYYAQAFGHGPTMERDSDVYGVYVPKEEYNKKLKLLKQTGMSEQFGYPLYGPEFTYTGGLDSERLKRIMRNPDKPNIEGGFGLGLKDNVLWPAWLENENPDIQLDAAENLRNQLKKLLKNKTNKAASYPALTKAANIPPHLLEKYPWLASSNSVQDALNEEEEVAESNKEVREVEDAEDNELSWKEILALAGGVGALGLGGYGLYKWLKKRRYDRLQDLPTDENELAAAMERGESFKATPRQIKEIAGGKGYVEKSLAQNRAARAKDPYPWDFDDYQRIDNATFDRQVTIGPDGYPGTGGSVVLQRPGLNWLFPPADHIGYEYSPYRKMWPAQSEFYPKNFQQRPRSAAIPDEMKALMLGHEATHVTQSPLERYIMDSGMEAVQGFPGSYIASPLEQEGAAATLKQWVHKTTGKLPQNDAEWNTAINNYLKSGPGLKVPGTYFNVLWDVENRIKNAPKSPDTPQYKDLRNLMRKRIQQRGPRVTQTIKQNPLMAGLDFLSGKTASYPALTKSAIAIAGLPIDVKPEDFKGITRAEVDRIKNDLPNPLTQALQAGLASAAVSGTGQSILDGRISPRAGKWALMSFGGGGLLGGIGQYLDNRRIRNVLDDALKNKTSGKKHAG